MSTPKIFDESNAPEAARPLLAQARAKYGFVPNLLGLMAASPPLLEAYVAVSAAFDKTRLSPVEKQLVLLQASFDNGCDYCMAAHSTVAGMVEMPDDVLAALRTGGPIADPKLQALRRFVSAVVDKRGWPSDHDRKAFLAAGYSETQAMDVLVGIGQKTLSNYTNHMHETPLDKAFEAAAWSRPASAA